MRNPLVRSPLPSHPPGAIARAPSPKPEGVPAEPSMLGPASGTLGLATAQQYLRGKNGPRDRAVAGAFLWAAVRKENTTALLLLAELYLAGDGVPKNCDQARILLMAAARKQIPEAITKLRELRRSGCP